MIPKSYAYKKYHSAHKRFIKPAIENFFHQEFPNLFGPNIRNTIAEKLIEIFYEHHAIENNLKPGQVLWRAVDKDTRADYHKVKYRRVVLTIINEEDISKLENGLFLSEHRQNVIARITQEAFAQGALLSMRDIGLLLAFDPSSISYERKRYEKKHSKNLPHTGTYHDMGSCITHKYQIIYKSVVEKKEPPTIASETNHSIKAVDHYLKDFNRVKTLALDKKSAEFIHVVTKISLHVIKQYLDIIDKFILNQKAS